MTIQERVQEWIEDSLDVAVIVFSCPLMRPECFIHNKTTYKNRHIYITTDDVIDLHKSGWISSQDCWRDCLRGSDCFVYRVR